MRIIKLFCIGLTFVICLIAKAQTDSTIYYAEKTFYDTRIVAGHSVEMMGKGMGNFIISHRFGRVNGGFNEFFGLDQSTIRIGFDYAATDWLDIGIGRNSFQKTYDGYLKASVLRQKSGFKNFPFSMVLISGMALNTQKWANPNRKNYFTSRLSYTYQVLIARKFHDRFSLQLMPTMVHRNLVRTNKESHDVFGIGISPKIVMSSALTLNAECYLIPPGQLAEEFRNYALAVGVDIKTKGHVFQLQLTNSRGMIEKFYLTETSGDWLNGDIHLGFNISRRFRVSGRDYKKKWN